MQKMRFLIQKIELSRFDKLKIENLNYFDLDYKNESNDFIVNSNRHIYYRDIFVWIDYLKDLIRNYNKKKLRSMII